MRTARGEARKVRHDEMYHATAAILGQLIAANSTWLAALARPRLSARRFCCGGPTSREISTSLKPDPAACARIHLVQSFCWVCRFWMGSKVHLTNNKKKQEIWFFESTMQLKIFRFVGE